MNNPEFQECLEYGASADKRPVFLSDTHRVKDGEGYVKSYSGIFSLHYGPWDNIPRSDDMPVFISEGYSNSYNHVFNHHTKDWNQLNFWSEGFYRYWDNIYNTDGNIGLAIWASTDDIFYTPLSPSVLWDGKMTPGLGTFTIYSCEISRKLTLQKKHTRLCALTSIILK
jgi:hypothetical protein